MTVSQDWREQLRRITQGNQGGNRPRRQEASDAQRRQTSRQRGDQGGRGSDGGPSRGSSPTISGVRPVYGNGLTEVFHDGRVPPGSNSGLIYDRYVAIWSGAPSWKPADPVRRQFLDDVVKLARQEKQRVGPLLKALHERRNQLWQSQGARRLELSLTSPLVSGVGMTHPLTAGFVWDRNLGVPYMPGSSLKGAVRAWANPEQWGALEDGDFKRIFGKMEDTGAGSVVFHDLYPIEPPRLRVDLVNPHFKDYYQDGAPPGDWLEPEPAFFLTVAAGTRFVTALHPRAGAHSDDLELATRCLREALENMGLGAKTAVGYGRFLLADGNGTG